WAIRMNFDSHEFRRLTTGSATGCARSGDLRNWRHLAGGICDTAINLYDSSGTVADGAESGCT
ncbi:hypothetical protein ACMWP3_26575, partial [Escherichia coli]|uniref:hypothetical protein n=1 Tax=Escherichia coli TaxID=562 RepID=UPI0039E1046F